jgi:homospermidine synthase
VGRSHDHDLPLRDRGRPFSEEMDSDDPWQFRNMRVT